MCNSRHSETVVWDLAFPQRQSSRGIKSHVPSPWTVFSVRSPSSLWWPWCTWQHGQILISAHFCVALVKVNILVSLCCHAIGSSRHLFLIILEAGSSESRVPANSVCGEGRFPGCVLRGLREAVHWCLFLWGHQPQWLGPCPYDLM